MKCPHCGKKINAASILGAAGKGKSKAFSDEERKVRSERMKALNAKRRAESQNDEMTSPHNERK
jgi:hypothetical protein